MEGITVKRCFWVVLSLLLILVISSTTFGKAQGATFSPTSSAPLPAPRLLKILNSDPQQSTYAIYHSIMTSGDRDYFLVDTEPMHYNWENCELWVSNGSTSGTYPVINFSYDSNMASCPPSPVEFLPFGEHSLLFNIYSYYGPKSFYITDGIATTKLTDGPAFGLTRLNDIVVFFSNYDSGLSSPGVWITDGTPAGTMQVKQIGRILGITFRIGQDVFFIVDNGSDTWLWKTDGTTQGTAPVKQISTTTDVVVSKPVVLNGKTYFLVTYPVQTPSGYEYLAALWGTDGSEAGTINVKDLLPTTLPEYYFGATAHLLFFVLVDSSADDILWQSDGTDAGTVSFDAGTIVQDIAYMVTDSDDFYFADHNGVILNKTAGKSEGFSPILNGSAFTGNGYASADGHLYFNNGHLWVTSGSGLTELVGSQDYSMPVSFTSFSNRLFFNLENPCDSPACSLWFTDGTPEGTRPYPNISNDLGIIGPGSNRLYLAGSDGSDSQLWVLDAQLPVMVHLPIVLK